MNNSKEEKHLLADVLGEGVSADFREGVLNETLRLARRRRRFRRARAAASVVALLGAFGLLVWHRIPVSRAPVALPAKPYLIVRTQPLPTTACVRTRPLSPARLVASVTTRSVIITAGAVVPVREIDDDELLALLPRPAALVRRAPHSAELVFVSQEDREELLRN